MDRDAERHEITDQIIKAVQRGDLDRVDDLTEALVELGQQQGKDDLLLDLWQGKEIAEQGVEFAIENNLCADPRKVK